MTTTTTTPSVLPAKSAMAAYVLERTQRKASDAYASTYKVRTADKGTKLTVRVTGSRLGYTTVSRTSGALTAR